MGRKRLSLLAPVLAVVAILLVPHQAAADDDHAKIDKELATAEATLEAATDRAKEAATQYAQASAALPAAQQQAATARGVVAAAEVAVNTARRVAVQAQEEQRKQDQQYDKAAANLTDKRDQVSQFVAAAYKGQGVVAFASILESDSPSDLAERMSYLERFSKQNKAAVNAATKARYAAREHQATAEDAAKRAKAAQASADRALTAAHEAAAAAAAAAAHAEAVETERADAKRTADSERGKVLAKYEEVKAESDRIAGRIQTVAKADPPSSWRPIGVARLLMPTAGWKSSDFGSRFDPYFNVWQLHEGMDIAADGGTPIVAADDGEVVQAGWNGGYGNYTCIYHGNYQGQSLASCYGHQSEINVEAGQHVRRGQMIGHVGTTGASTGNHLHFEVRLDGGAVNPEGWLPGCLC